jgi:hypothetical protein
MGIKGGFMGLAGATPLIRQSMPTIQEIQNTVKQWKETGSEFEEAQKNQQKTWKALGQLVGDINAPEGDQWQGHDWNAVITGPDGEQRWHGSREGAQSLQDYIDGVIPWEAVDDFMKKDILQKWGPKFGDPQNFAKAMKVEVKPETTGTVVGKGLRGAATGASDIMGSGASAAEGMVPHVIDAAEASTAVPPAIEGMSTATTTAARDVSGAVNRMSQELAKTRQEIGTGVNQAVDWGKKYGLPVGGGAVGGYLLAKLLGEAVIGSGRSERSREDAARRRKLLSMIGAAGGAGLGGYLAHKQASYAGLQKYAARPDTMENRVSPYTFGRGMSPETAPAERGRRLATQWSPHSRYSQSFPTRNTPAQRQTSQWNQKVRNVDLRAQQIKARKRREALADAAVPSSVQPSTPQSGPGGAPPPAYQGQPTQQRRTFSPSELMAVPSLHRYSEGAVTRALGKRPPAPKQPLGSVAKQRPRPSAYNPRMLAPNSPNF